MPVSNSGTCGLSRAISRSISHMASYASSVVWAASNASAAASYSSLLYWVLFESPPVQKKEQWNDGKAAFPSE